MGTQGESSTPPVAFGTFPALMPAWARAEMERRVLVRSERRARRRALRPHRRAVRSMRVWTAAAAATPVAVVVDGWGWVLFGAAAAARAGLSWWEARATADVGQGLPLATMPAPSPMALRGSRAAEPLLRGESAMAALAAFVRAQGPGPVADALRSAMAAAADVVDGLRVFAARVAAGEAAARAVADPARRGVVQASVEAMLAQMRQAAAGLDGLLQAATDVVATATVQPGGYTYTRLDEETIALRGLAAGLRDLTR
jgi:hypothetical protein